MVLVGAPTADCNWHSGHLLVWTGVGVEFPLYRTFNAFTHFRNDAAGKCQEPCVRFHWSRDNKFRERFFSKKI